MESIRDRIISVFELNGFFSRLIHAAILILLNTIFHL